MLATNRPIDPPTIAKNWGHNQSIFSRLEQEICDDRVDLLAKVTPFHLASPSALMVSARGFHAGDAFA